jgi:hypothetical protein
MPQVLVNYVDVRHVGRFERQVQLEDSNGEPVGEVVTITFRPKTGHWVLKGKSEKEVMNIFFVICPHCRPDRRPPPVRLSNLRNPSDGKA